VTAARVSVLPNPFDHRRRVPGRGFIAAAWWDFCAFCCWSALKICYGLRRVHRERVPRTGPILVISNHQSFLDPMINGVTVWDRQFTALARDTLFVGPFGWLIRSVHAQPIKRSGGDLEAMRVAIKELESGRVVILYPEGTRSQDGQMLPFKRGVMLLIKRVKPTVLPMGVDGAFDAWPRGRKLPKFRGKVVCACGEPLDGAALAAMSEEEALATMHAAVSGAYAEARTELTAWRGGGAR
jgi:1-acyl-sn-glycerol-3-phosphate acyltransferase